MFTVYSKPNCSHCVNSKNLLKSKNLPYQEIILDVGQDKEEGVKYITVAELKAAIPSAVTMPQILNEGKHIGGFKELQQFLGGA